MSTKDESQRNIGEGHAAAMARLGLKELRGAFYPQSNVAQPSEYGLYGTRTCEFRKVWRGAFRKVWRVAQGSEGFQQVEPGEDVLARAAQMPTRVSGPGGG